MIFAKHCVAAWLLLLLLAAIRADDNEDDPRMPEGSCSVIELNSMDDDAPSGPSPPPLEIDCDEACSERCRLSSRPHLCKRACGTCCKRCDCVPPGTSGNYDACPCYANMTTHGGRHKCP